VFFVCSLSIQGIDKNGGGCVVVWASDNLCELGCEYEAARALKAGSDQWVVIRSFEESHTRWHSTICSSRGNFMVMQKNLWLRFMLMLMLMLILALALRFSSFSSLFIVVVVEQLWLSLLLTSSSLIISS